MLASTCTRCTRSMPSYCYLLRSAYFLFPLLYAVSKIPLPQVILLLAALYNRTDHYIFALWFLSSFFLSFSFFFLRLISAVADWMSVILPHMVWP